jgi:hypothetical protein
MKAKKMSLWQFCAGSLGIAFLIVVPTLLAQDVMPEVTQAVEPTEILITQVTQPSLTLETLTQLPSPTQPELPSATATELVPVIGTEASSQMATPMESATAEATNTEALIETPPATQSVWPTETALVTTSIPVSTPTPTETPLLREPVLTEILVDNFDSGVSPWWILGAGWSLVSSGGGQALQSNNSELPLTFQYNTFYNVAAEARFLISVGSVQLSLRQSGAGRYTVTLDTNGQVILYRADQVLASSLSPATSGQWRTLRVSIMGGGVLRISVDGNEVIGIIDPAPLPPGTVAIAAQGNNETPLLVDDFRLWLPTAELPSSPTEAPTAAPSETPTQVSSQVATEQAPDGITLTTDIILPPAAREDICAMPRTDAVRTITWAGQQWYVKDGTWGPGPGPAQPNNWFSDSSQSVFVDSYGRLHLRVRYINGRWYTAEICSVNFAQYGVHRFFVETPLNNLDANVVGGIFLYRFNSSNPSEPFEIDIEASRWGDPNRPHNVQYVVQPFNRNGRQICAVDNLNMHCFVVSETGPTTHYFNWQPASIEFVSMPGLRLQPPPAGQTWTYTGSDNPSSDNNLRIHINLWLVCPTTNPNCTQPAPASGRTVEVILADCFANPGPVTLLTPANRTISFANTPTFTWSTAVNARDYRIQISSDPSFSNNPVQDATVDRLSYTATPFGNGVFYYRVQARNCQGGAGPWSSSRTITVTTTGPTPLSPINGASLSNLQPSFTCRAVAGAIEYQFRIDTDNPMTEPTLTASSRACSYRPPSPLIPRTYYWNVRTKDASGNWSTWSDTWSVNLTSPALIGPALSRFTTPSATLTCRAPTWATSIEIQIDNNANFASPEDGNSTVAPVPCSFTTISLPDMTWNYRIRGCYADSRGRRICGRWSIGNFIIDTP